MDVRIGISAGEPVTDDDDLFGAAVQLAARLCACANPGGITVSVAVRELCIGKRFRFGAARPDGTEGILRTHARLRGSLAVVARSGRARSPKNPESSRPAAVTDRRDH